MQKALFLYNFNVILLYFYGNYCNLTHIMHIMHIVPTTVSLTASTRPLMFKLYSTKCIEKNVLILIETSFEEGISVIQMVLSERFSTLSFLMS